MNKEYPLTENFIRTLHKTLLREDYTVYRKLSNETTTSYIVHAGCYKTRPNSVITVTGERFEYASPEEKAKMEELMEICPDLRVSDEITFNELDNFNAPLKPSQPANTYMPISVTLSGKIKSPVNPVQF